MTEPSGLRYRVDDAQGDMVVPSRPVEDLVAAMVNVAREAYQDGRVGARQDSQETRAAQRAVLKLLGLEPEESNKDFTA